MTEQNQIEEIRARHVVPEIDTGKGGPIANPDCVALLSTLDNREKKLAEARKAAKAMQIRLAMIVTGQTEFNEDAEHWAKMNAALHWEGK